MDLDQFSNLQYVKLFLSGVFILKPLGSKIECVKVTKSISKLPSLILLFKGTTSKYDEISIFFSLNFSKIKLQ